MLKTILLSVLLCLTLAPLSAQADWTLQNDQSKLHFASIKAGNLAEVHHFTELACNVSDSGAVTLTINTASVETLIPIRNDRMRDMLFQSGVFPNATFTAQLDPEALAAVTTGVSRQLEVSGELSIRENAVPVSATLLATRVGEGSLVVSTIAPIMVDAARLGLGEGVEMLREVAGLPSISTAVPVTFSLSFSG